MPLDPQLEGLLALLDALDRPPIAEGTPAAARADFRTLTVDLRDPASVIEVADVQDRTIEGATGAVRLRIYRPPLQGPLPTVVFFHGGGFVIGDLDTHDNQCRWVCRETGAVVVSVEYRLAPEAPFPGALEDCLAATRWAAAGVDALGGDPQRLAVAGDSAGGNLAAVVAAVARDEGGPPLAAQLLIYPATDLEDEAGTRYPSRLENAEGFFLTAEDMRWFADHYTGGHDRTAPLLSPLFGDLADLPPAVVVTAEYDPLRDEGDAYAAALREAGVPVVHHRFEGLIHGFFDLTAHSAACVDAVRTTCASFRRLLEPERLERPA